MIAETANLATGISVVKRAYPRPQRNCGRQSSKDRGWILSEPKLDGNKAACPAV